jgi:hypothetical protein
MTYYFAYGSNMLIERLQAPDRVPSAKPVSHAKLEGWRLQFDKKSKDESGKCHIVPSPGDWVYGVVFLIPLADRGKLDKAEGHRCGYERERLREVILGDGSKVEAFTYVSDPKYVQADLLPYDWYHALVVEGAKQHQLPPDYQTSLQQMVSIPDPQADRPTRLEALSVLAEARGKASNDLFPFHRPCSALLSQDDRLHHLSETTLYYPCCGSDWAEPLRLFGPWVRSIRFVELHHRPRVRNRGQLDPRLYPEWQFLSREGEEDATQPFSTGLGQDQSGDQSSTISERYCHLPTGREVVIHWHRSDARLTLNQFSDPLGVFFHRGDRGPTKNPGEGSSGSHWLSKAWLEPVIARMVNKGFVVTDGSCGLEYPELCRFYDRRTMDGQAAVAQAQEFTSGDVHFKCVGFAGMRYGPTLIWQISKLGIVHSSAIQGAVTLLLSE